MGRRPNGSGTMYRRNGVYYAKISTDEGLMRVSLGTRVEREAVKRLDALAKGYDLSDDERLAALERHLRPKSGRLSFDAAWLGYCKAPENIAQTETAKANNATMWAGFMRWLHGQDKERSRLNCKAAYPGAACLADITEKIAAEFVEWLKANRSPETANKIVRVMKRVWTLNLCEPNPWRSFRKLKVDPIQRRALSVDEVDFLIDKAEGELKLLFTLGAFTGMRLGDCQHFRWEMICGDRMMVRTSKTKRLAGIPIHQRLRAAFGKVKSNGYVMPVIAEWPEWKLSKAVQDHFAACGFSKAEKKIGYKKKMGDVGFHSLRSTFITRLAAAGVPLAVVREMVGHVSEEMSQRYFRADADMAAKAIAALG